MRDIYTMKGMAQLRLTSAAIVKMRWDISLHQAYNLCTRKEYSIIQLIMRVY